MVTRVRFVLNYEEDNGEGSRRYRKSKHFEASSRIGSI